ncbi:MAG TPA: UBP-type zinc finger domain-containing protein, partial [Rhodothermales bacterium]|nr:UBP-type zinc finger domain-containing protein [Rhodothermales bacterium]
GLPVLRGDYTKQHILTALGLMRARLLVVPDDTPAMAERVVAIARALAPDVHIVAAVPTAADAHAVVEAGADRAVAHHEEAVLGLLDAVLAPYDAALDAGALRGGHYAALHDRPPSASTPSDMRDHPAQTASWIDLHTPVMLDPDPRAGCTHGDYVHAVTPGTQGCAECLAEGRRWVHLRVCMTCGHVGCCDSSPGRHATAHFHASGHPISRSIEPGETWGWCYVDEVTL